MDQVFDRPDPNPIYCHSYADDMSWHATLRPHARGREGHVHKLARTRGLERQSNLNVLRRSPRGFASPRGIDQRYRCVGKCGTDSFHALLPAPALRDQGQVLSDR
jgi:hypothetical protein